LVTGRTKYFLSCRLDADKLIKLPPKVQSIHSNTSKALQPTLTTARSRLDSTIERTPNDSQWTRPPLSQMPTWLASAKMTSRSSRTSSTRRTSARSSKPVRTPGRKYLLHHVAGREAGVVLISCAHFRKPQLDRPLLEAVFRFVGHQERRARQERGDLPGKLCWAILGSQYRDIETCTGHEAVIGGLRGGFGFAQRRCTADGLWDCTGL